MNDQMQDTKLAEQAPQKQIVVSNFDKIRALAYNERTTQRFMAMLGTKREAQAYVGSAMLVVANSDDLKECTPSSILNSAMRAASLGLWCDIGLRQAYIVPFNDRSTGKKNATLIIGYIGINNMAMRTRKYRYLNVDALYEGQTIEINQLTGATTIHGTRSSETAKILGYFHYFELKDGLSHTLYMTVEELQAHGQKYAPKNPMWKNKFPDMCKKTVTRLNLLKFGILDPFDRSIVEEMSEDKTDGELIESGSMIDAEFTEQDDNQAELDAKATADARVNAPKRNPQDIINELTGANGIKLPETEMEKKIHADVLFAARPRVDAVTGEILPPKSQSPIIEPTPPTPTNNGHKAEAAETPKMSIKMAESEWSESANALYGMLPTETLEHFHLGLSKSKKALTEEQRRKRDAIEVIMAARAAGRPVQIAKQVDADPAADDGGLLFES